MRQGYSTLLLDELCQLVKNGSATPERASVLINFAMGTALPASKNVEEHDQNLVKLATSTFALIDSSSDLPLISLTTSLAAYLDLFAILQPSHAARTFTTKLLTTTTQTRSAVIRAIINTNVAATLRDEHIDELIPLLNALPPLQLEQLASLLNLCTHSKPESHFKAWEKWQSTRHPSLIDIALSIAADKTKAVEERRFALKQLHPDIISEAKLPTVLLMLAQLINSEDEDEIFRADAMKSIYSSFIVPFSQKRLLLDVAKKSPSKNVRYLALQLMGSKRSINMPGVAAEIQEIFNNKANTLLVRAQAALSLSNTNKAKNLTRSFIELLEEALAKRDVEAADLVGDALSKLSGLDHGRDIKAWCKELKVTNIEISALQEPDPLTAPALVEIQPLSLDSRRGYDFIKGEPKAHDLILTLNLIFAKESTAMSYGGFVVEEVITDRGEVLKSDWQKGIQISAPIAPWAKNKKIENTPDNKVSRALSFPIGSPTQPCGSLKKLKGYVIIRDSNAVQNVSISPRDWLGKQVSVAELKDLKLYILAVSKKTIVLQHIGNKKGALIKSIKVIDSSSKEIPIENINEVSTDRDGIKYEILMRGTVKADYKIALELYADITDRRVPFELKSIRLDNETVRPATPEF